MVEQKSFPLEKILTVSARDYVESQGNHLSHYDLVGIHDEAMFLWMNPTEHFADLVPADAEVVVDYRVQRSLGPYEPAKAGENARGVQFVADGTALILKSENRAVSKEERK